MTKTLTEQWRERTLDQRYYYVKYFGNCQKPFVEIELKNFLLDLAKVKDNDRIEVLAPVPSYEEYNQLKQKAERADYLDEKLKYFTPEESYFVQLADKKLAIATKALNDILNDGDDYWDKDKAQQALTKMKGVK